MSEEIRGRGRPALPRTCGNCGGIRFSDAQLISNIGGTCVRADKSGRQSVKMGEEACPFFILRSPERARTDETRREVIRLAVGVVNKTARARRGQRGI